MARNGQNEGHSWTGILGISHVILYNVLSDLHADESV